MRIYQRKRRQRRQIRRVLLLLLLAGIIFIIVRGTGSVLAALTAGHRDDPAAQTVSRPAADTQNSTIQQRLMTLAGKDKRVQKILDNYEQYPEPLLDMLSRNIDMLDFVLEYPQKKGQTFATDIGKVSRGTFPLLLQWDGHWGYGNYGGSVIAVTGCAPTALAMVVAGLTGSNDLTPDQIADYAMTNGYYAAGQGTSWSLMSEGSRHFGVKGRELSLTKDTVYAALQNGQPIICSVGPGDFTTEGHYIVLTGIKNGKIKVNDPNSKERSKQLWDYDTLSHQIKNLWVFSL